MATKLAWLVSRPVWADGCTTIYYIIIWPCKYTTVAACGQDHFEFADQFALPPPDSRATEDVIILLVLAFAVVIVVDAVAAVVVVFCSVDGCV